jgi:5-methylthioribose kinase
VDAARVAEHLRARGLVAGDAAVDVQALSGGVSGEVAVVSAPGFDAVVKRALGTLLVRDEWIADEGRVVTEGWALRLAGDLAPGTVPRVLDLDPRSRMLVIDRAPVAWTNWRDDLLAGHVDPAIGARLGTTLAVWHRDTADLGGVLGAFADKTAFVQLRIDPFHRRIAERHPDLEPAIHAVAEELLAGQTCLVHGDFSPKNVLVGDHELWVLDWEVAHVGDPVFDLAYLLCHLVLKTHHVPACASAYRETARRFLDAYGTTVDDRLAANVGCLLLARVDGKSPADYLTAPERDAVRTLGRALLVDGTGLRGYV